MNTKEIILNDHRVLIVDAPDGATHSQCSIYDGANFLIYRKSKLLETHCFDQSKSDNELNSDYSGRIEIIGALKNTSDGHVANLFNVVKHGNFYDYNHNGVFYPSAVSALKDIVEQETGYSNPYVLIIKPF